MNSNKVSMILSYLVLSFILLISTIWLLFSNSIFALPIYLNIIFILIITMVLIRKLYNGILFEPIVLYSIYFYFLPIAALYIIGSGMYNNVYIAYGSFKSDPLEMLVVAILYSIIGYITSVLGYELVVRKINLKDFKIEFEPQRNISDLILNLFIFVFFTIGFINFVFNIISISGGNILNYFSTVSIRKNQFEYGGTTVGYNFLYVSIYIWFFKILRKNQKLLRNLLFLSAVIFSILVRTSTGRIFSTLIYVLSFFIIYYFVKLSFQKKDNLKYSMGLIVFALLGIIFYSLRLLSSFSVMGISFTSIKDYYTFFLNDFGEYAVGKGNLPNVAVLMKIIDSWEYDIGYLYGSSFLSWIVSFFGISDRDLFIQPSVYIKQVWYTQIPGGNLPPTGIGEMYANFGFVGILIGMFIFGALMGQVYKLMIRKRNYWMLLIYTQLTAGFFLLYPKGEFDNLNLWAILPVLITYTVIRIISTRR